MSKTAASQALTLAAGKMRSRFGSFYGPGGSSALGVGTVYDGVRYPLWNPEGRVFDTAEGPVYVLTHECDVDQTNAREFNEKVLICPLLPLEQFASDYLSDFSEALFLDLVAKVASDDVFRVAFFPPIPGLLPYGALLYLNEISNTHVAEFDVSRQVAVLSETAQQAVDWKIENHLLRPKSDPLPRFV